ncbi:hypothetical protein [Haploplasma axanthum]|uniref:FMN-binding domain-containing protein n=1 Tax=Haploplasma axanthum TaxID=29552 RepID=A0A449BBC2_HAPAX|nr:hypothetical protein [Haploplasma axanthum]VEU79671.1 Uncharacterised protein [Haploplasma axanthum]
MKNLNVKNILVMLGFIFVILGVLIGSSLLLKNTRSNNIMKQEIKKYTEVLENISEIETVEVPSSLVTITDKKIAKNASGTVIGTLYSTNTTNNYGNIEIILSLDTTGKILGIKAIVNQTLGVDKTIAYISGLKGSSILDPVSNVDVTGVTRSNEAVNKILNDVKEAYKIDAPEEEKNVYEKLFGDDFKFEIIEIEENATVKEVRKILVNDVEKARVYKIEKTGMYTDGMEDKISFNVILGLNNEILGYEEVEYKHTGGTYKRNVLAFFNELVNEKVLISAVDSHVTEVTGSTNSRIILKSMLNELAIFVEGDR